MQQEAASSVERWSLNFIFKNPAIKRGSRCWPRDGTASIPARTVRNTPDHAASTSPASTSSRRAPQARLWRGSDGSER
jgi:hypothetical protein